MTLEDRILRLARLGMTPYQIEEQLGIKHFTIHIGYHKVLQQGYSENDAFFDRTAAEQLSGPVTEEFRQLSLKKRPVKETMTEEELIEKRKAKQAEARAKNTEKKRSYYQRHREEILAYQKRWREMREKLDEKHKRRKENGTGKARNASGADAVPGNGQGADGNQLSA
ncbi:hypothetical protein [Parasutterella sp.]|uniref:hypothetical protein n=1 Tax=Parasutterella sp. TaxID=2049037 RepID=UPI0020543F2C|nr:MAG TPA: hypothetical protein [Caudoviricetes sp.]